MGGKRCERSAPSLHLIGSLAIAFLLEAHAAQGVTKTKLVPADAQAQASFGESVALDGDTVVVGAHEQANFQGAVYVFVKDQSGWVQQAKLTDANVSDFGFTVSIRGDDLIVGAGGGHAYVYHRTGTAWSKQATLVPKAGWDGVAFAAISGDYAVVTLPLPGNGHVFKRSGSVWAKQAELSMNCVDAVAIDLDYVLIACTGDPVQVFKRIGNLWLPQATLTGTGDGAFGESVSINGNLAIVSEPGTKQVDEAIYIFQKNGPTWTPTKFGSPSPALHSFGNSASISPHHALAGKPYTTSYDTGGACLYRRNGSSWSMSENLTSGVTNDFFGYAVAVSDEKAVVGAPTDSSTFPDQGAAYVFEDLGAFLDAVVGLLSALSVPQIEIGCEIIDCCPGCPGPPYELDWQIRLNGPIVEGAELWFPTLSPDASRRMRVQGNATWVGVNRLRVGRGQTVLRGFSVNPKFRAPVAIPKLLLDESAVRSLTSERKELGRLELVVEQMLGRVVVSEYQFTYDVDEALRSAPKLERDTARIEKPRSR